MCKALNISQYIKYIKTEIKTKELYDEYAHAFKEYKEYLENTIEAQPCNVTAICQLAITYFELREFEGKSIKILKDFLNEYSEQLTDQDKARIYTNLAYFYEEGGTTKDCFEALQKAVSLNPKEPNAYDALGRICCAKDTGDLYYNGFWSFVIDIDYLIYFKKASALSSDWKYHYNYGVALYCKGEIQKAKTIFEKLSQYDKVKYALAVCHAYLGDKQESQNIADIFFNQGDQCNIDYDELADVYYLCQNYQGFINCMDKVNLEKDSRWMAMYFYSLKVMGNFELLTKKYERTIENINRYVEEIKNEEIDDVFTQADKDYLLLNEKKRLDDIAKAYTKIITTDIVPKCHIKLPLEYGCYLIDCPRCQKNC